MRFDPADPAFIADPYPAYEELRELAPVRYDEATDHWLVSRYADVNALLRDPSLITTAVEELMRYDTPLHMFERWVLEPVEVRGVPIPKGAELGLLFGSANRDPTVFDRPDAMDVTRDPNPHLTFGAGTHFCLGALLARIELQTSFGALLDRFPRIELAEPPEWKATYVIRGLRGLRVRV
jgi:cytochrome P450